MNAQKPSKSYQEGYQDDHWNDSGGSDTPNKASKPRGSLGNRALQRANYRKTHADHHRAYMRGYMARRRKVMSEQKALEDRERLKSEALARLNGVDLEEVD